MAPLLKSRRKDAKSKTKPPKPAAVAHIVTPASKLNDAAAGEKIASICGVEVTAGVKLVDNAPVCPDCFLKQLEADDTKVGSEKVTANREASARATARYNEGLNLGQTRGRDEGRRALQSELATLAQSQAEQARREAEAPRYVDLGKSLKLRLVDGGEATVRKNRVGAVQLLHDGPNHAVVVDGHAVHVGTDEALAKRHFDDLHEQVFGTELNQGVSA